MLCLAPGEIQNIHPSCATPESLNTSCAAILLALADMETSVWLSPEMDSPQARDFLKFHTGCRIVEEAQQPQYALINTTTDISSLNNLSIGNQEYPDRSTTLIIALDDMRNGEGVTLSGPGIETSNKISLSGISTEFWQWLESKSKKFPCGIDAIFASDTQIAAVPRTTKVEQ